jgi:hypothetical protein|tara:strand:- start:12 stop:113 length:102 start_codon:yes stop_codon:yes gene_type:complete
MFFQGKRKQWDGQAQLQAEQVTEEEGFDDDLNL